MVPGRKIWPLVIATNYRSSDFSVIWIPLGQIFWELYITSNLSCPWNNMRSSLSSQLIIECQASPVFLFPFDSFLTIPRSSNFVQGKMRYMKACSMRSYIRLWDALGRGKARFKFHLCYFLICVISNEAPNFFKPVSICVKGEYQ